MVLFKHCIKNKNMIRSKNEGYKMTQMVNIRNWCNTISAVEGLDTTNTEFALSSH